MILVWIGSANNPLIGILFIQVICLLDIASIDIIKSNETLGVKATKLNDMTQLCEKFKSDHFKLKKPMSLKILSLPGSQ